MWIKSQGKFFVDRKQGIARVHLNNDFADLYLWLLRRELSVGFKYRVKTDRETADPDFDGYGMEIGGVKGYPHITVANKKHHKLVNWKVLENFRGQLIKFKYNPNIKIGGWKSDFWNFYLMVESKEIDQLRVAGGLKTSKFLHITVGNTKSCTEKKPKLKISNE